MQSINSYIIEKLQLNKQSKILGKNYKFEYKFLDDFNDIINKEHSAKEVNKMTKLFIKGVDPQTSLSKIKNPNKLILYWWLAIRINWEDYYDAAREKIIKDTKFTEDDLDRYVYCVWELLKSHNISIKEHKYLQVYMDKYDIKYDT